jgi:hypothetical protein
MEHKEYNGWHNYETWAVNLWMDNSQPMYQDMAQEYFDRADSDKYFTQKERAIIDFADVLKEEHSENMPEVEGVYSDLLSASLSEVNWYEIAEHYMEEIDSTVESE